MENLFKYYHNYVSEKKMFSLRRMAIFKIVEIIIKLVIIVVSANIYALSYITFYKLPMQTYNMAISLCLMGTFVFVYFLIRQLRRRYQSRVVSNAYCADIKIDDRRTLNVYKKDKIKEFLLETNQFDIYSVDSLINRIERKVYQDKSNIKSYVKIANFVWIILITLSITEISKRIFSSKTLEYTEAMEFDYGTALGIVLLTLIGIGFVKLLEKSINFYKRRVAIVESEIRDSDEEVMIELLELVKEDLRMKN